MTAPRPFFDARDARYKTPFGAVPCGGAVTLTVYPDAALRACFFVWHGDFSGESHILDMTAADDAFTLRFTVPAQPELVWYHFRCTLPDGVVRCWDKNGWCGEGESVDYQLTVYDTAATPRWFGEGVTYQIFPDRFCRTRVPCPDHLLGQRTIHPSWDDDPAYAADPLTGRWNSDFFGGELKGITQKLNYLQSLHVTTLYLNPIFYAASNHRYDTADYHCIDPMLGTEEDLTALCGEAEKRGIRVILDGVFNHTGAESRYFNRGGAFSGTGAFQSKESPYYPWYSFRTWPRDYEGWWNIATLPAVNESDESYRRFIITDEDSVIRHYLRCGVSGWRLDVADELPDDFIAAIRRAMTEENPDSFLLGEVWEDGSNKIAYSCRRRYLLGHETDGLMNYPFRTAALAYLQGGDAAAFREAMETVRENYPPAAFYSAMNLLGTHDTPRLLTLLGASHTPESRSERAAFRLSPDERAHGVARLKLAALLQYAFPGSPSVYYGDEAGVEGWEDPFNRRTYPWGREDETLLAHYRVLGALRASCEALRRGDIAYLRSEGGVLIFRRRYEGDSVIAALNVGSSETAVSVPWETPLACDGLTGQRFLPRDGVLSLTLPACSGLLLTDA